VGNLTLAEFKRKAQELLKADLPKITIPNIVLNTGPMSYRDTEDQEDSRVEQRKIFTGRNWHAFKSRNIAKEKLEEQERIESQRILTNCVSSLEHKGYVKAGPEVKNIIKEGVPLLQVRTVS